MSGAVTMFFESDTFPFRFMLETCVHFEFWNKKNKNFQFFFLKISEKSRKSLGGPFENFEKYFYFKNQTVHMFPA